MLRDPSLIPLSHQHHNGLSLCVLTERSLKEDASPDNVAKLARKAIDRYEIELANHFQIEEEILFPACESALTAELRAEHRALEGLIGTLRTAPAAAVLTQFTSLLRGHIRKEENDLFEAIQKDVSRETLDALGRKIEEKVIRVCL